MLIVKSMGFARSGLYRYNKAILENDNFIYKGVISFRQMYANNSLQSYYCSPTLIIVCEELCRQPQLLTEG